MLNAKNALAVIVCISVFGGAGGCASSGEKADFARSSAQAKSSVAMPLAASLSSLALGAVPDAEHRASPSARDLRHPLPASDPASNLSVLTFNLQHEESKSRLKTLADHMRRDLVEVPDFILLQEVMFQDTPWSKQTSAAAVLAGQLGYQVRATKRTSDREGVAILSRYPFEYYGSINLKSQTSRLLLGFRRVSVMAEFMVPGTGRVRVVNVHLTNWGFEERVRENQLQETLEWIAARERRVHADVIFLGGDFNMKPDGDEIKLIVKANQWKELDFENWNSSNPTRGAKGRPSMRVDYIFVSALDRQTRMIGKEELLWKNGLASRVGDNRSRFWLSDHLPVLHQYSVSPVLSTRVANSSGGGSNRQVAQVIED